MKNNEYMTDDKFAFFPELELDESDSAVSLLIKHDYYSSDSNHGRLLLSKLLASFALSEKRVVTIILIDSGVKLLDDNNLSHLALLDLMVTADVYTCQESLDYYLPDYMNPEVTTTCSAEEIFTMITGTKNIITVD